MREAATLRGGACPRPGAPPGSTPITLPGGGAEFSNRAAPDPRGDCVGVLVWVTFGAALASAVLTARCG